MAKLNEALSRNKMGAYRRKIEAAITMFFSLLDLCNHYHSDSIQLLSP